MPNMFLDFRKDENVISQDRITVAKADEGVILYTYFLLPIRFSTKKVEFFEWKGNPWLPLPVLHFATIGYEEILKSYTGFSSEYYLPDVGGKIIYEKHNDQFKIVSTYNGSFDIVNASELIHEYNKFIERIKNLFLEEIPEILLNDYWKCWLLKR